MSKQTHVFRLELPKIDGASEADVKDYVLNAVASMTGALNPEDPLYGAYKGGAVSLKRLVATKESAPATLPAPALKLDEHRWAALWNRLDGYVPEGSFDLVQSAYSAPDRAYHGVAHILHCLRMFDFYRHMFEEPDLVELALWLHDVVYDTHSRDSEERSADLAEGFLREVGLDYHAHAVRALIMCTRHDEPAFGPDAALLADIDLSILGADLETYIKYENGVRQEYSWVQTQDFLYGRKELLMDFVNREQLFQTDVFQDRYGRQARSNLYYELNHVELDLSALHARSV